ncbi:MAG: hypothetical protein NC253_09705 [Ruminococcus sp.]|nr:hypothetical protein [Ruminococcus sp.]MCM1381501.1 hypothetical protein [Muribaculaceae bacterium]MCM1480350.1 hypothetical protein [Muribaculaceae bacterium]
MSNKNNKDTYDKLISGTTYGDLFSESGFDEMQKAKNYEIGFKLFRAFFWIMYFVSMGIIATAVGVESTLFAAIGFGVLVLCTAFYLLYAAKASAAGVMNPKFAAQAAKKSYLVSGIIVLTLWLFMLVCGNVQLETAGMWIILSVIYIGNYICSRRNMKVLEKMLKENEEE